MNRPTVPNDVLNRNLSGQFSYAANSENEWDGNSSPCSEPGVKAGGSGSSSTTSGSPPHTSKRYWDGLNVLVFRWNRDRYATSLALVKAT